MSGFKDISRQTNWQSNNNNGSFQLNSRFCSQGLPWCCPNFQKFEKGLITKGPAKLNHRFNINFYKNICNKQFSGPPYAPVTLPIMCKCMYRNSLRTITCNTALKDKVIPYLMHIHTILRFYLRILDEWFLFLESVFEILFFYRWVSAFISCRNCVC